jgi:LPXTG-motif cell wall-anchored protein
MRIRHGLAPTAVALALAVPSAAYAQGAGDDQYTDPFSGSSQPTPTATPRSTPQATATPAPAPAAPAPAQSSSAPAATATPAPAQGPAGPTLPYTGVDAWIPGLSGALLLGGGIALRRRLRDH